MPLLLPRCARRLPFKETALRAMQLAGHYEGCGFLYVIARRAQAHLSVIARSEATRQSNAGSYTRLPRPLTWPRNDKCRCRRLPRLADASLAMTEPPRSGGREGFGVRVSAGNGRYSPKRQRKLSEPSGRLMRTKPSAASTVRHSPAKHSRSYIAATDRQPFGANSCAWRT